MTDAGDTGQDTVEPTDEANEDTGGRRLLRVLKGQGDGFDLRNTWQVAVGAILMPLGLVIILIAWYGAAHASHVQQQIPYLVSGAFIGLGLMIVGGLLYWAHWLYRVYDQADLHHKDLLRQQDEHMRALIDAVTGAQTNGNGSRKAESPTPGIFVATASGTNFHRPDCPVVSRSRRNVRTVSTRDVERMQPCRICDPLQAAPAT